MNSIATSIMNRVVSLRMEYIDDSIKGYILSKYHPLTMTRRSEKAVSNSYRNLSELQMCKEGMDIVSDDDYCLETTLHYPKGTSSSHAEYDARRLVMKAINQVLEARYIKAEVTDK